MTEDSEYWGIEDPEENMEEVDDVDFGLDEYCESFAYNFDCVLDFHPSYSYWKTLRFEAPRKSERTREKIHFAHLQGDNFILLSNGKSSCNYLTIYSSSNRKLS